MYAGKYANFLRGVKVVLFSSLLVPARYQLVAHTLTRTTAIK